MQKQTLVERIIAFLKGGDEAKLSRFESKLNKYLDNQIKMRKESIEKLREKIADASELLNDSIVQVNTSRLNTSDGVDDYISDYVRTASSHLDKIEKFEADIGAHEEEIARFGKLRSLIYPEVQAPTT